MIINSYHSGLPKSCQEIRDAGIGRLDGQYIIEARPGCHLSIICQDMEDKLKSPKEFLGGPSEDEWKYWHYAVLIKLSYQDKLNMPSGACLEKSGIISTQPGVACSKLTIGTLEQGAKYVQSVQ